MNERIKKLRKELNMTQDEFSSKIGLSRNFIAQLETGAKKPSDRTVADICREFNINENWLRTGEGEMHFSVNQDERFAANLGKIQRTDDETIIRWVNMIAETNPSALKEIEEFMKRILGIEE